MGVNATLGIVLLCAPLAAAAQRGGDLRAERETDVAGLTRLDASRVPKPSSALPAGSARRSAMMSWPDVTLWRRCAKPPEERPVAFQYTSDFTDIFEIGLGTLARARGSGWPAPWAVAEVYLAFFAGFPDSHIARKNGLEAAARVQIEAVEARKRFMNAANPAETLQDLLSFDRRLKARGLNPGTSADLTVASVFADRLTRILINRRNDG